MKFARTRGRALVALAGFAAALNAPAQAADDKSTVGAVMELFGYSSDPSAASIDYRERPKLVLPPRAGELPAPKAQSSRPENWPIDAAAVRRRNSDRYARIPNAAPVEEERKPGVFDRLMGDGAAAPVASNTEEPTRRMLTEPPPGYRRPTMDLSKVPDKDPSKKSAWWNPMTYLRGGNSESAPGAPGADGKPQQANSRESGGWFKMPRFVVRDPKDEKD